MGESEGLPVVDANKQAQEFCRTYGGDCKYKKECQKSKKKRGIVLLAIHHQYGESTPEDANVVKAFKNLPEHRKEMCQLACDRANEARLPLPGHQEIIRTVKASKCTACISNIALKRIVLNSIQ